MSRLMPAVLAAAALSGCEVHRPVQIDHEYFIAAAEDRVRTHLLDPSSAEFFDVVYSAESGIPAVCGSVRARNGFGGMAPAQRFISGGDTALEREFISPEEFAEAWRLLCR